jgi:hypothetical protein
MDRYVNLTQTRSLLMYGGACNSSRVLTLILRDGQTKRKAEVLANKECFSLRIRLDSNCISLTHIFGRISFEDSQTWPYSLKRDTDNFSPSLYHVPITIHQSSRNIYLHSPLLTILSASEVVRF